ncbi:hypothetical protein FOA52_005908 [Chlamydomonas sp. UWO 241]|nr:hypothetical protein FOA52_005908 [Chlamydomonas sp. UWO 241]
MRGLPAEAAAAQQRHSFVAALSMEDATAFAASLGSARDGVSYCRDGKVVAVTADLPPEAPCLPVSLPVCLGFVCDCAGREGPAGGSVVSASLLNDKPTFGGTGVEPKRGAVLRVLFTVTSDAVADNVARDRCSLRSFGSTTIFVVLTDTEEAQLRALRPAFVAVKAAGKQTQFHRARLMIMIDGERVPPPACKSDN